MVALAVCRAQEKSKGGAPAKKESSGVAKRTAEGLRAIRPVGLKHSGRLTVRLFGHLEVALDGERVAFATPRKSLQLLAYLWLHPGTTVSREYLAFLLYPDDEESAARAKLRGTLAELPKILPASSQQYVTADSDGITWNAKAETWIDVAAFLEASGDPARLAEAIDLYRGDLLPEVYDEWLDEVRHRLREVYLRCLDKRISEARRDADFALAIEAARRMLAADPWREDVVRRIVAIRYESGDRAGALSEYAAFSKRLRDELAAEPMPETAAVAERIARGETLEADGCGPDRREAASRFEPLPFVGRRDEMDRLLETWSRVARGRGASAFVGGEIGIGKSRLVQEFGHAVEDRGGRMLVGMTGSPEAMPYESIADALRFGLPMVASLKRDAALAGVATLLPELHARVDLPPLARLEPEADRVRLFESLFRCIAGLAAPRPLLLVLEDLHWAQPATIDLLEFLIRRVAGARVMLLVTYRSEEAPRSHPLHRLRHDLRVGEGLPNIRLSGLSVGEVDRLREASPEARHHSAVTLAALSQGNPLFLSQLLADAREGAPAAAPASLQEAVSRRIARLSSDARTIAEIGACMGDRFSHDAVREVSAWEETALGNALQELFDRRLVREASGRGFEYTFTHNLVQTEIAREIPRKTATVRRRRIAHVLEELYPERFSELSQVLAGHYEFAGDVDNAARCFLEAVRRSLRIGAPDEARILCARALALDLTLQARAELSFEKVTIESRCGDRESRNAALLELEAADSKLDDARLHRDTLLARNAFAAAGADIDAHEATVKALLDCAGDARWDAAVNLAKAEFELKRGRLTEAASAAEASLTYSRTASDEADEARALCFLAKVESHQGNLQAATTLFDDAAARARAGGDPALELFALTGGWVVVYQGRDLKRCRAMAERSVELAVKLGDRHAEAQALGRMGIEASAADARRYFNAATKKFEEIGDNVMVAAQLLNRAVLETQFGFFERAEKLTETARGLFQEAGDERGRIGALSNLTFLKACQGNGPAACEIGRKALDDARRHGLAVVATSALENLAMAEGVAGDIQKAIALAQECIDLRTQQQSQIWSAKTLADIAIWHLRCGELSAARVAVAQMLSDEQAIALGIWPAYSLWAAAHVTHRAGDAAEASRLLQRARAVMEAQAEGLEEEDRASFLALPFHRSILHVAAAGVWPDAVQ